MFLKSKRAQSTLEYAIIIAVVVGALILMQAYMKRGIQGKLRSSTDEIGEQFSPGLTTGSSTATIGQTSREVVARTGGQMVTTNTITRGSQNVQSNEAVTPLAQEPR